MRTGGTPVPPEWAVPGTPVLAVAAITIGGVLVLVVRGPLCSGSSGELAAALDWAFTDHRRIVIDASGITRCDPAGLAPIVDAAAGGRDLGVRVVISGLDQRHYRWLPAGCTGGLCYPTMRSALTAVGDHSAPPPLGRPRAELLAEIDALRGMVASRAFIEQAKGVLLLSHGLPANAAFDLLRWYSQQRNVRVRDLAAGLVGALAGQPIAPATRGRVDRLLTDVTAGAAADGTGAGANQ